MTMAIACATFTSCNTAPDVAGSWRSMPQNLSVNKDTRETRVFGASIEDVITFTPAEKDNMMGTFAINSTISMSAHAGSVTQLIGPYQTSIAATSTINGTWAYSKGEDNEIDVVLDFSTLNVSVDPESVEFVDRGAVQAEQAEIDQLTPQLLTDVKAALTDALGSYYSSYAKLDDVSVSGNNLTLELDGRSGFDLKVEYDRIGAK